MVRRKFRVYTRCSLIAMLTMFIPILIRLPVVTISTFHYVFYGCDSILLYKANISNSASIYPYHRNIPHSNNGNVDILFSVHLNFLTHQLDNNSISHISSKRIFSLFSNNKILFSIQILSMQQFFF